MPEKRNKALLEQDSKRNDAIAVIRAAGERPFATYKSRYGLARTRFMGLEKKYDRLRYRRYRAQPAQRGQVLDPLRPAGPELCWISAAKTQKWGNKPRQITHIKL